MRGKIIHHEYNEKTGYTKIIKATQYGSFIGEARVHPDDQEIANV